MEKEKRLAQLLALMSALNFSVILYYALVPWITTRRICASFSGYDFLAFARQIPHRPWIVPLLAIGQYFVLCVLSYAKLKWITEKFMHRLFVCFLELLLCAGIIISLGFYYSGIALVVLSDLVHYVRNSFYRLCFIAALVFMFAFGQYEVIFPFARGIAFNAYLSYYNPVVKGILSGAESFMASMNILLFTVYMILLFTGQRAENTRIKKLNDKLNQANERLRDYAVNMENMTEMRERNRLAREIHDTLGHTLTGIIMGADAALVVFDALPGEAKKRIELIAQTARDGLNDVRRSINALRPDAIEKNSLDEALKTMFSNFHLTTSAQIHYTQNAGELRFASDEEDTIYRIVQEGMTNAVRHGHATEISITITRNENMLTIYVDDNGVGCPSVSEGFGLRHMKERLDMLGGLLVCGNREGKDGSRGFYLLANFPVREREGMHSD